MARYKVEINGTADFEVNSSAPSASRVADEIARSIREGDGDKHEIRLFWDQIAVLDVWKVSE